MKHRHTFRPRTNGFTLVEIAIVMAIVALLLGGLLVPLSAQVDAQRNSETVKAMSEIREALMGFALANGRLPCPADPTIATGAADAGKERPLPCTGANAQGVVPWTTLGIPETDAWGRRYTYRVTEVFADAIGDNTFGKDDQGNNCIPAASPPESSFALCSVGDLEVKDAKNGNDIATKIPAVVISHGKNGYGAYTPQGTQTGTTGADDDEKENSDVDKKFVSHVPTSTFDDQVTWISTNILKNRMVAAGKLP